MDTKILTFRYVPKVYFCDVIKIEWGNSIDIYIFDVTKFGYKTR